jgi:hypothetical protein
MFIRDRPELRRGQSCGLAVDVRLDLARVDPQLLELDRLTALDRGRLRSSSCCRLRDDYFASASNL